MTPADSRRTQHGSTHHGGRRDAHRAAAQPGASASARPRRGGPGLERSRIAAEVITVVVCAPLVPVLMVTTAVYHWPSWWLIVAGMLAAWTADAVRVLARYAHTAWSDRRLTVDTTLDSTVDMGETSPDAAADTGAGGPR